MKTYSLIPIVVLFAAAFLATPASAQAPPKSHNEKYVDPELDVERMVDRFESEGREVFDLRDAIVAAAEIQPGDVVADVGAGTGAFLDPLVAAVGKTGQVVAVEIAIRFVEHLRQVADDAGYDNVTVVFSSYTSATLPPASVDKIILIDTYHHFDDYESMLASLRSALRSGGEMIVVDFDRREDSRPWIQSHVRAAKQVYRQEIEAAGFAFVAEVELKGLEENFLFRFRKP